MNRLDPRLVLLLAAAGAAICAFQAPWWTVTWPAGVGAAGEAGITGATGTGGLAGVLALVVGAAVLATLTLGVTGRRAMGVLAAVASAGMAALGFTAGTPARETVEQVVRTQTLANDLTVSASAMPLVYGVLGLVALASALWLAARPPVPRQRERAASGTEDRSPWKAMDAGEDPTA